jgi:hypothetical protein
VATLKNEIFENKEVVVDDTRYEGCAFYNCTLVYRGGQAPEFIRCSFRGGRIQLEDDAVRTPRYLGTLYVSGASQQVEGVLARLQNGTLADNQRPVACDPVNTGEHYGRLGLYSAVFAFVIFLIIGLFWFGYLIYPTQQVLGGEETRPLSAEIPLDVMPSLPLELQTVYDGMTESQLAQNDSFAWLDADSGAVQIPVSAAIELLLADSESDEGE